MLLEEVTRAPQFNLDVCPYESFWLKIDSNHLSAIPHLGPQSLSTSSDITSIQLEWSPPSLPDQNPVDVIGYQVFQTSPPSSDVFTSITTQQLIPSLIPNTEYSLAVLAVTDWGNTEISSFPLIGSTSSWHYTLWSHWYHSSSTPWSDLRIKTDWRHVIWLHSSELEHLTFWKSSYSSLFGLSRQRRGYYCDNTAFWSF